MQIPKVPFIVVAVLLVASCATQPKPVAKLSNQQAAQQQAQIADLQKQIDSKDAQIASLNAQAKGASDQLAAANAARSALQAQLASLTEQKTAGDTQLAAMSATAAQLEKEIANLQSAVSSGDSQVSALKSQLAAMQKSDADLSAQLDALRSTASDGANHYTAQIDTLNKQAAALRDQISALQKQQAAYESSYQASQQGLNDRIAQLRSLFAKEIAGGMIDIKRYRDVLVVSVKESTFFVPDYPTLLPGGEAVLQKLAQVFKMAPDRVVRVEGNTAVAISSPASLKLYPTSWHLGAARAANVVQYLQDKAGLDPKQLVAASLGQYSPVGDNSTEKGKAENRRVDFVMIPRPLWQVSQLDEVTSAPMASR